MNDCTVIGKGFLNNGLALNKLVGNIYKSSFKLENGGIGIGVMSDWIGNISYSSIASNGLTAFGICTYGKWTGNLLNSNITGNGAYFYGIFVNKWTGKISKARIISNSYEAIGIFTNSSTKGNIYNSVISTKKGFAVIVSKNVKISSSTLISAKKILKFCFWT